ncbi:hypothetical protein [Microlunatus speluncae]|uniref:hypothetical protein n=1 Tax=Microlunatus speluncae TaxID=2594267 RepID=UPI0012662653|nr:hypothetical protein [Microlunatus speluncae]
MTFVRSLAPWIVFGVLGAFLPDRWAVLAAAGTALIALGLAWRSGRRPDELVIELSSLAFFTVLALIANLAPASDVSRWAGSASELWLAGTVAVTLALHRPFTLALARAQAPREHWDRPEFYRFNVIISRAWLISFAAAGLILLALAIPDLTALWFTVPVMVLAILIPIRYTASLVKRIPKGTPA